MTKTPDDLVVRILREIQGTLSDHTRRFETLDQRFTRFERRLDEVNEGMITALGLAGHAHVRHEGVEREIEDLKRRVERLEEKL